MLSQQGLVGSYHVLARFQHGEHDRAGWLEAADQLGHNGNRAVVDQLVQAITEQTLGQLQRSGFIDLLDNHAPQLERTSSPTGDPIAV